MNHTTTLKLRIEPGQARLHLLAGGSRITAAGATVRVDEAPQWLAETVLRASSIIRPGGEFVLRHAGWVTLSTDGAADVWVEAAARPQAEVVGVLRALVRRWRRRIGAPSSASHAA